MCLSDADYLSSR